MQSVGDPDAARIEVDALAGTGSEIGKMAEAFVKANANVSTGARNFPAFRVLLLPNAETGLGPADEAIAALKGLRSDLIVDPYDASNATLRTKLRDLAVLISGPDRDLNGQFGTTVVAASIVASATALLFNVDSQYVLVPYLQDTNVAPGQPVALIAAASAGALLQLQFPYFGLDDVEIGGLLPPTNSADRILVGATELSELVLAAGLTPLRVDASGRVRFVRTVTTRVTINGSTPATAYRDWQDFSVLYDYREDLFLALQQPQFKNKKASIQQAQLVKDEALRIAGLYEQAQAFQRVKELAKLFQIQPSSSSRGRFDFKIPVNVIAINHVTAGNIEAGTLFDEFTL
jgi:phage tail sheath gpL-like